MDEKGSFKWLICTIIQWRKEERGHFGEESNKWW